MNILVIDGGHMETEFRAKFGSGHEYRFISLAYHQDPPLDSLEGLTEIIAEATAETNVVFLMGGADFHSLEYQMFETASVSVFMEATRMSLTDSRWDAAYGLENKKKPTYHNVFGFCGLPTLLNRPLLEVSLYDEADRETLAATCAALDTDYRVVADRVGLVTPRVICQLINEACYTVQEGTATMQDVDLSMKLGTNYPHGPFAWANAIGVGRVYDVLEALWQDTHDERYKVCPLLKRQALRGEAFAV